MATNGFTGEPMLPAADELGLLALEHHELVTSTMDVAHARAANNAPAGTLILADMQSEGRGRAGKRWSSAAEHGVWMTLIERPGDPSGLSVLSLRLGLALAAALEPLADDVVRVKWPNDLFIRNAKLAGILVETRWRVGALDWVAIGIGINLRARHQETPMATLRPGTTCGSVLRAVVPVVRAASRQRGTLAPHELEQWNSRDLAIGRAILEPVQGVVRGLAEDGALRVETPAGTIVPLRSGSLVFQTPQ